ncbi:class I SAM-dependent methyltransferase [Polymorphospora sp. NPDC051019]|uniref:class I SAM-dependent methyltransferase n=1 Tax=Polymorphospora sp. NPDC051019 TaxID=3155725 RepID=UPI0034142C6F
MTVVQYALDNAKVTASPMLDCLSEILDEETTGLLGRLPLVPTGRYWVPAAGNGSVARWLARTLGPTAEVVASDADPRHIPQVDGLRVVRRDDVADGPLPGEWDGIPLRLFAAHTSARVELVHRYASVLRPGGVLVDQEWGVWSGFVQHSPYADAHDVYEHYQEALRRVFDARGNDATWSVKAAEVFEAAGLVDVRTTVSARSWPGGSAGCRLVVVVAAELREQLIAQGADPGLLDRLPEIMHDPETVVIGNATWTTVGFAPA